MGNTVEGVQRCGWRGGAKGSSVKAYENQSTGSGDNRGKVGGCAAPGAALTLEAALAPRGRQGQILHRLLPHQVLLGLARHGHGEAVHHLPVPWHLVPRNLAPAELPQLRAPDVREAVPAATNPSVPARGW